MNSTNDKLVLNSIFNPLLPNSGEENVEINSDNDQDMNDDERSAKQLEVEAVNAANAEDYERSLELLSQAIRLAPKRASCYNNRAQVYRVKERMPLAFEDLNQAIKLSAGKGLVARQAYCQRGLINLVNNKQQEGIDDMKRSAELGNEFAKSMVTQLNPYAALCNKMLKEMIDKVRSGQGDV